MNQYSKNRLKQSGFTLIELMIAMVIGLIILLGMISLFTASSSLNLAQTGLAVLQENGRYAITRLKQDFESAGRKHCATLSMPDTYLTKYNQGFEMSSWQVDQAVTFTNGLPLSTQVFLDDKADPDQFSNALNASGFASYPVDPSFFIKGFECNSGNCQPALTIPGADSITIPAIGVAAGSRADNTDIITVRYLNGGNRVTELTPVPTPPAIPVPFTGANLSEVNTFTTGDAIIADCSNTFVTPVNWGASNISFNSNLPDLNILGDTRVYNLDEELSTVTYYVGIDQDVNDNTRLISSLYRSENGNIQQLVEGVERFDLFYLAQLQTGHVVRLTADQVNAVNGGGDINGDDAVEGINGCIVPPEVDYTGNFTLANDNGCLWRSIYAIEVHLLLNTVNNSAQTNNEQFKYSPDGIAPQTPGATLPSGLSAERMYRREFTAIVPVRSYTL